MGQTNLPQRLRFPSACGCVVLKRFLQHLPWIDTGTVDGVGEQAVKPKNSMLVIKEDTGAYFGFQATHLKYEVPFRQRIQ